MLAIVFFDKYGMVYVHYMKEGHKSVDAAYYKKVLMQLEQVHVPKTRPQYTKGRMKLHRDNACPHVMVLVANCLARKDIRIIPPKVLTSLHATSFSITD